MILKNLIRENHQHIENMPFNQRLIKGQLNINEYLHYLYQLFEIYTKIETKIKLLDSLERRFNITFDMVELEGMVTHKFDKHILSSTINYVDYLDTLNVDNILPHVYLNYMALLFGGQMIKKSIHGKGQLYDFNNVEDCIKYIRDKQENEWADEVNKGFVFLIKIYEELQKDS